MITRDLKDIIEEEEAEKEVYLNKRIYKDELLKVDMGYRRSTDMKTSMTVAFFSWKTSQGRGEDRDQASHMELCHLEIY